MRIDPLLVQTERLTVVDDVVTKGATLLAVASIVRSALPDREIKTFAMIRTMGYQPDVNKIVDPCVGMIRLDPWGEVDRQP